MIRAIVRTGRTLWSNRRFTLMMARYEMQAKNKGAILGIAWLLIRPIIHLAAYVAVLHVFAGGRLNASASELTTYVLSGLVVWQAVQRTLEEAPSLVRDRIEILKQVSYPLETLPATSLLSSSLGPAVGLVALGVTLAVSGRWCLSVFLLPLPLAMVVLFALGASWVLMVVGAVLRDLREIVAVSVGLAVYLSPVMLSEELVGERLWRLVLLNPLSHIVVCFRDVLFGTFHMISWLVFAFISLAAFALGAWVVDRAKMVINEYL
jgi:lipopolysaccharide transport system permease protein